MELKELEIEDYKTVLHYNYLPDYNPKMQDGIEEAFTMGIHNDSYHTLIRKGKNALTQSFNKIIETIDTDKKQVIPLSSGLDSRTILAHLINHPDIDKSNIYTVTFGSPETYDLKYGQLVAEEAGVENQVVDLRSESFDWSLETLRDFAESDTYYRPGRVFDKYAMSHKFIFPDEETVYWDGFMGGELAGYDLSEDPISDWEEAVRWFTRARGFTQDDQLTPAEWEPDYFLPSEPYYPEEYLNYELQLDFFHRMECLIKDITQVYRTQTPYLQKEWLEFILKTSQEVRFNRKLFKDICGTAYPKLFSIPSDATDGVPLSPGRYNKDARTFETAFNPQTDSVNPELVDYSPHMNYINFNSELMDGGCLYPAAETLVGDFAKRDEVNWFDSQQIWERHQSGEDLTNEVRTICSLELYLSSS